MRYIIAHYLTTHLDEKTACGLNSAKVISITSASANVGCKNCKRSLVYRKAVKEGK